MMKGRALSNGTFGFLLTLPALVLFGAIVLYPLIGSLSTSLFKQSLVLPGRSFVGLDNFKYVLDRRVLAGAEHTLVFTGLGTVAPFVIGFALALALNTRLQGPGGAARGVPVPVGHPRRRRLVRLAVDLQRQLRLAQRHPGASWTSSTSR